MEPDSVTRHELEVGLSNLQEEFEAKLEKVQDRLLTAVFGFVNGASARMERLESADNISRKNIARLEQRLRTMELRGPRAKAKKAQ
jgi:hypothetical protein